MDILHHLNKLSYQSRMLTDAELADRMSRITSNSVHGSLALVNGSLCLRNGFKSLHTAESLAEIVTEYPNEEALIIMETIERLTEE